MGQRKVPLVCLARSTRDFVRHRWSLSCEICTSCLLESLFKIVLAFFVMMSCGPDKSWVGVLGGGAGIQAAHAASYLWAHAGVSTVL